MSENIYGEQLYKQPNYQNEMKLELVAIPVTDVDRDQHIMAGVNFMMVHSRYSLRSTQTFMGRVSVQSTMSLRSAKSHFPSTFVKTS